MKKSTILTRFGLLSLVGLAIVAGLTYLTYDFGRKERQAILLESARTYSAMMTAFRTFYSQEIVSRLKRFDTDVTFSHNYKQENRTLPLPATMTLDLSEFLSNQKEYPAFEMRSRFPFTNRGNRSLDAFTERALKQIEAGDRQDYFEASTLADGKTQFSYAQAIYMQKECVACHNQHPLSTNRNWQVGDLRGIQQVSITDDGGALAVFDRMQYLFAGYLAILTIALAIAFRFFLQNRKAMDRLRVRAQQSHEKSIALQEATDRLFEVEGYLQDAIAALPDGFVLYDKNDRLVLCNDKYREIYADSAEVIQPGMSFESIIRYGVERGQYPTAMEDPERWIEQRMEFHYHPTSPIEQKLSDGRWLRVFEQTTERGQIVGFRVDITELKEREQALAESESQLRATLESALDGIIVIDANGYIKEFNESATLIFGFERSEALDAYMSDLIIPHQLREAHQKGMAHYQATGEGPVLGQRITVPALHKEGHEITIELAINPAQGTEGELFIAYVRDVTEILAQQKALEDAKSAAEQAAEAKSAFLAIMSHEIRTPLNGLIGLLELVEDKTTDIATHHHVVSALDAAVALTDLLNAILDYSRIEEGKIAIKQSKFRLTSFLKLTLALVQPIIDKKGLTTEIDVDPALPQVIKSDAVRLRQMLLNLLGNAAKFSHEGHITLRAKGIEAGDKIRFEVQDQGIGIEENDIPQLFERFSTLDSAYNREVDGSGLGLSITKSLAELMGGAISVESVPGKGSTFIIELPLVAGNMDLQPQDQPVRAPEDSKLEGLDILLAEDNPTNRLVMTAALQSFGMTVTAVENGQLALDEASTTTFDLVILDISMPVMDGLEAVKKIRLRPDYAHKPILAFTAYSQEEEKAEFLASGFDAIISKPARKAGILSALLDILEKKPNRITLPPTEKANDPAPDLGLIDTSILDAIIRDVPDDVKRQLAHNCVNDIRSNSEAMMKALEGQEWEQVHRHAHILKGVTATFGLWALNKPVTHISDLTRATPNAEQIKTVSDDAATVPALSLATLAALDKIFSNASPDDPGEEEDQ